MKKLDGVVRSGLMPVVGSKRRPLAEATDRDIKTKTKPKALVAVKDSRFVRLLKALAEGRFYG